MKPKWDLSSILTNYNGNIGLKDAINKYHIFLGQVPIERFGHYSIKPSQSFINRSKRGPNGPSIAAAQIDSLAVYKNRRLFNAL